MGFFGIWQTSLFLNPGEPFEADFCHAGVVSEASQHPEPSLDPILSATINTHMATCKPEKSRRCQPRIWLSRFLEATKRSRPIRLTHRTKASGSRGALRDMPDADDARLKLPHSNACSCWIRSKCNDFEALAFE